MKATCHREGLLAACQLASAAIPSRDLKPILKNVKAIAGDGRCTLLATDLEVGIRLDVQGLTIEEGGEAILPAARLIAILRQSRDSEVQVETDANSSVIRGAAFEFEMPGENPDEFPELPSFPEERHHSINAGVLRTLIRRTLFAAADNQARFSLAGVLLKLEGNVARLVATDGHRLALAEAAATACGDHSTAGQTTVVPVKGMQLLERCLEDGGEEVRICVRPNEVLFRTERAVLSSRLVEGRYPDYKKHLPKKEATRVSLPCAGLLAAVRQAAIMTDHDSRRVILRFTKDRLTLQAQGPTAGRSKVELPIAYGYKALEIAFNPVFLIELCKALPADVELTLSLTDGNTPAVFRSGNDFQYVVMPLS